MLVCCNAGLQPVTRSLQAQQGDQRSLQKLFKAAFCKKVLDERAYNAALAELAGLHADPTWHGGSHGNFYDAFSEIVLDNVSVLRASHGDLEVRVLLEETSTMSLDSAAIMPRHPVSTEHLARKSFLI